MLIDKSQFFQVFFDEMAEHLAALEELLINLDVDAPSQDDLNTIFRAVHSIKGGAGTFGFQSLAEVAHILESVLDMIRKGMLPLRTEMIDLFLETEDVLRGQMAACKEGGAVEAEGTADVCERLKQLASEKAGVGDQGPGANGQQGPEKSSLTGPRPLIPDPQSEDPGYGFFEDLVSDADSDLPPDPRLPIPDPLEEEGERRSPESAGRRATDNADGAGQPVRASRRATDKRISPAQPQKEAASLRISVDKVDQLFNQVGEIVITQAMLTQTAAQLDPAAHEKLSNGLTQLERNTRDLQDSVMAIRMVPIRIVFSRFPRLVRDMSRKLNKEVELITIGEETEVDKGFIEKLVDPLTHLLRNAIDHGIEPLEQRTAAGKGPKGVITLRASHRGGKVVIEVKDNGAGLNREKILSKALACGLSVNDAMSDQEVWQLIFAPGFSTADVVTNLSGRGVGMDVVMRNAQEMDGHVEIQSEAGCGSRFIIYLPLTLAIIEGMTVRVGGEVYIFPLTSIIESIRPKRSDIKTMVGRAELVSLRGDYVPIVRLYKLFGVRSDTTNPSQGVLVIVEMEGRHVAVMVDELLGQQQVVIKSLEQNFVKVGGIAGATILGDGRVAFILDVRGLFAYSREEGRERRGLK